MKKILFFLLLLFTWYLGGMYRYLPLMVLLVAEVLLAATFLILSRYFCRRTRAGFAKAFDTAQAGQEMSCQIWSAYSGPLSPGQCALRLRAGYQTQRRRGRKWLHGVCESGETSFSVRLTPPYCGLLQISLDRLRTYDYVSLFSARKSLKEHMEIAVFPSSQPLRIELSVPTEGTGTLREETFSEYSRGDSQEIRQMREYRPGDSVRRIHWNLSARTGVLWLKEYQNESSHTIPLRLNLDGLSKAGVEQRSAFYTLLAAITRGFLRQNAVVRLYWSRPEGNGAETVTVTREESLREALLRLYRMEKSYQKVWNTSTPLHDADGFRLDSDLSWYAENSLIFRFSPQMLEREIREKTFIL